MSQADKQNPSSGCEGETAADSDPPDSTIPSDIESGSADASNVSSGGGNEVDVNDTEKSRLEAERERLKARNDNLTAAVKHVRLIHFMLTATSATVFYIVVFAWSDAQIVRGELGYLKSIIAALATEDDQEPKNVLPAHWSDQRAESILRAIESSLEITSPIQRVDAKQIEMVKRFDRQVLLSDVQSHWPAESATIRDWRDRLEHVNASAIKEVTFDQEDIEWAKKRSKDTTNLLGVQTLRLVKVKGIDRGEGFSEDSGGQLIVELFAESRSNYRGQISLVPLSKETKLVKCSVRILKERIPPDDRWFTKIHPHLCVKTRWESLKDKTIHEAIRSVDDEISGKLGQHEPTLIGIKFHGQDIGWAGPLVIIAISAYLFTHLRHISHRLRSESKNCDVTDSLNLARWIGAMPERWPSLLTLLTLAFVPALAILLSAHIVLFPLTFNLYGWKAWVGSGLVFTVAFSFGMRSCAYARDVAKQYLSLPTTPYS